MAQSIPEMYGSLVFNDKVMRSKLPKDMYKALKKTIENGTHLELDVANSVAVAMKEWATENGATHYTHWFQPMTNVTAEKHDSFISPTGDGQVIMDFSGKELVKGEPDASSFPSGGLRATFEARGYTAWDPTSPAFIKDKTLYIPTAFCSYSGEALDKKTPLLRSMDVLNKEAVRILHILGNKDVRHIDTTVGPEQEYFLVDKDLYKKRKDLIFCGRTLLGASAPKGQEMEDHYFGALKPRVAAYMHDLDEELWKLGIPAKTKHNEVAPAQHEIDFKYGEALKTADNIETFKLVVKTIAKRHGLCATFMPKPKYGVCGSGMHMNMSLQKDGKNIFADENDKLGLSQEAYWFIAGIMEHMKEMTAITNPLVNSYKRLVPGYEAPIYIAWSAKNRSPLIRIPSARGAGTRVELRCPDPTANPYLAMAVCLKAGLDGIKRQLPVPASVDTNIFNLTAEEKKERHIHSLPANLREATLAMSESDFMKEAVGNHIFERYTKAKMDEWNEYTRQVTDWEISNYLYKV